MIDVRALWDFSDVEGSLARLQSAKDAASGADQEILSTQVARALGLLERYDEADALLDSVTASHPGRPAVEAYLLLERGRLRRSRGDGAAARSLFEQAVDAAAAAELDAVGVDAMHMVALTLEGQDQISWTHRALDTARSSQDQAAQAWAASLLNNLGMAYSDQGQWPQALHAFEEALVERQRRDDLEATHVARWMVAWALRNLGRHDEALTAQRSLRQDMAAAGVAEDRYVVEEIEILERDRLGDPGPITDPEAEVHER